MAATSTSSGPPAGQEPRVARLTLRVFLAVSGVVATILALTLALFSSGASVAATVSTEKAFSRTASVVNESLEGRERGLANAARVFAINSVFRSTVADTNQANIFDQAIEAADALLATWVQITDASGIRLARSDDPTAQRADVSGSALIAGALSGETMSGFGSTGDSSLFQAIAVPVRLDSTTVVGTLMAALAIDSALAAEVKAATESEVLFFVWDFYGAPRVVVSTLGSSLDATLEEGMRGMLSNSISPANIHLEIDNVPYVGHATPLSTAGGDTLGGVLALRSRATEHAVFDQLGRRILFAGGIGFALAIGLSLLAARFIARPLVQLAAATQRGAQGDYSAIVDVKSSDEIGTLAAAVRTMLADLREKEALAALLRDQSMSRAPVRPLVLASTPVSGGMEWITGSTVAGRYTIREALGAGGAGVVYRAMDRELDEVVAIKTVLPEVLGDDATALDRLKSEIRLARRISHRNVVRTHDLGEADGVYFITMECISGTSVRDLIDSNGKLPVAAVFAIGKQLSRGLEAAHEQGIIHRDIKPQNLMLQPDGVLKIMDFGVARLQQRTSQLTQAGLVVGTPDYMAPEQLLDEPIDPRADLYAVGVVLYECLTGRRPFEAETAVTLIGLKLSTMPKPPREVATGIPDALSALVMRLLAKTPAERPATAGELHDMLVGAEE